MNKIIIIIFTLTTLLFSDNNQDRLLKEALGLIWQEAMIAKNQASDAMPQIREELLENLCSSAPSVDFVTHADLSEELAQAENTSASVFVSTDNQNTWVQNNTVLPLDQEGYETTWGATTITDGGNNIHWYLQGSVDSESLGLDFGQITVSQSPYNQANTFPPSSNLYATVATDATGETGSGQDIVSLQATYSDDKLFAAMNLNGSCCNEGSFFGPWNLYSIAIVNPDAENPVAYAYAYGNGGFGQLYPAVYKIDGDLTTGEVGGFEVLSENFDYSTSGNTFSASSLLSIITNDSDWGEWPNSFNGVAIVGANVSAGLSGLDISTEILDTSDLGVLVLSTQTQNGNTPPVLSNPSFDAETGILSVAYTDAENNLATVHDAFIDDMGFIMIPDSHTYSEGVIFSAQVGGGGMAQLYFSDGGNDTVTLEVDLGGGSGGGCQAIGDANADGEINVLDVVLTVNLILCADCPDNYSECSDINSDGEINVLDVVSLVNLILGRQ
ncbi:MAG: hypothetical protein CMG66_01935 [Candidatus Marinimicrobia bacterium]|nr:hypothetical protein [Candidatus Neomarinimicrobiota bacterium]|tara:strand:- start:33262 stop:34758 length:1497 start_codon:yes stop_codon:yes gene_type:complete